MLDAIIKQGEVIGMDLVEVAPDYDMTFSISADTDKSAPGPMFQF